MKPSSNSGAGRTNRVLFLAKGYPPDLGGVEQYSFELASRLPKYGFRTFVVTQHTGPSGLRRRGAVAVVNVGPGPQWLVFLKMWSIVLGLKKRGKFSFAYATTWRVALPLLLGNVRCPIGVTIHGREILMPIGLLAWLMRSVLRRVNCIFAVSDFTLREAIKLELIPQNVRAYRNWNGIADKRPAPASSTLEDQLQCELLLLSLSRLVERKNLSSAIKAFAKFQEKEPDADVKYVIAGEGAEMEALKELANRICKSGSVVFAGRVSNDDKAFLYSKAKIFLHPHISLHGGRDVEGFGLVIAEAMDWGLAVIAGKHGGASDFVDDQKTGLIIDGNSVDEIENSLRVLYKDRQLITTLGKAAKNWVVGNLSWNEHTALICRHMCESQVDEKQEVVKQELVH